MKDKNTVEIPKEIAQLGFEMLWIMKDTLGHIIASENGGTKNDEEYYEKCSKYIKWFASKFLN